MQITNKTKKFNELEDLMKEALDAAFKIKDDHPESFSHYVDRIFRAHEVAIDRHTFQVN